MNKVIDSIKGLYFAEIDTVKDKYTVMVLKFRELDNAEDFCGIYRNALVKEKCDYTGKITVHMVFHHNDALEFLKWLKMDSGSSIKEVNMHSHEIYDRIAVQPTRIMTDINPAYVSFDGRN